MNDKYDTIEDDGEFEVGGEFAADLKLLYGAKRNVPVDVDRAVLAEARKHLGKKHLRLRFARWAGSAAAVAAVVVFAFVHNYNGGSNGPVMAMEDIDRNGRVDILDAFALAVGLKSDETIDLKWDLNGDGIVDGKDVDAVAASAVRLKKGV